MEYCSFLILVREERIKARYTMLIQGVRLCQRQTVVPPAPVTPLCLVPAAHQATPTTPTTGTTLTAALTLTRMTCHKHRSQQVGRSRPAAIEQPGPGPAASLFQQVHPLARHLLLVPEGVVLIVGV